MIRKHKNIITYILIVFFISACGEEAFAPKRVSQSEVSNPINTFNFNACSSFTLIKPKVDFLFLWDNSTSSVFINDQTKQALNRTIDNISSRFDYHVMMAPLVVGNSDSLNSQAKLISENTIGLASSALNLKIDRTLAAQSLNFSYANGSREQGVDRAIDLIKGNVSNGIFRANSYVYVVLMSNQDDSSWERYPVAEADRQAYLNDKSKEMLCLRGNYSPQSGNCTGINLNSIQMRFMSVTAFNDYGNGNSCGGVSSWKKGATYQQFSKRVYLEPYRVGGVPEYRQSDQNTRSDGMFDSYDICAQSSFTSIFDGINASINDTLITHRYNYWPLASSGASSIDPEEIRVFKEGVEMPKLNPPIPGGASGFTFNNYVQTVNTRFEPTPGEPFTGYVVRLYGNAIVNYPECIRVQTQSPKEWFGYVNLQTKPVESSIQLKINGQIVPQSTTNGWQLIKSGGQPQYFTSKNIKISGPGNFCPSNSTNYCVGNPSLDKSGYFIQLFGNAVYSNGATIEVIYDPSS